MGDRAPTYVTCRTVDEARFEAVGFTLVQDNSNGSSDMEDEQRNYANTDDLPRDIPFYGSHGAGCEYGEGVFACDGKEFMVCESIGGQPAVRLPADGVPDPKYASDAATYWRLHKAADLAITDRGTGKATAEQLAKARAQYAHGSSDNIEVDDGAEVSEGDDGVWVQAWVWLENDDESPDPVEPHETGFEGLSGDALDDEIKRRTGLSSLPWEAAPE